MKPRSMLLLAAVALGASASAASVTACTDNGTADPSAPGAPTGDASREARADGAAPLEDGGTEEDSAVGPSTCELTRAYETACNKLRPDGGGGLTCGEAKFDAWCDLHDKAINSDTYRRAEAMCLTESNCDPTARRDCEYKTYATATPTAAQKAVVVAYCQTCEPMDQAGCVTRKTSYDPAAGPKSTDDVFVAAWELGDALVDEIRVKCTGAVADAGASPNAAACLKEFASCAGGIYVDRLPDCP